MRETREPPSAAGAAELRARFEHGGTSTFGVEEEAMLLDPRTLDLAPRAAELIAAMPGIAKLELPASQVELAGPPAASLATLAEQLAAGRRRLAAGLGERALPACAGVHPFASAEGELNRGGRYERLGEAYGSVARRQLVCALHVHVALDGADRSLAVYNAMRSHLPELAALAANAPVHLGADTGMASVRPLISGTLPRQGIPPPFADFQELAGALAWLMRSGRISAHGEWWWELRLHPRFGTLEVRVADSQTEAADAAAVAACAAGVALWLSARYDAGDLGAPGASWRIAENRFSAARHGVFGEMADPASGTAAATADRLHALLDEIAPFVAERGGSAHLGRARMLVESGGGAARQRAAFAAGGAPRLARELADSFLAGCEQHDRPEEAER